MGEGEGMAVYREARHSPPRLFHKGTAIKLCAHQTLLTQQLVPAS